MECIALKAGTILPILLLQRPHANSTAKEHVACLTRRLIDWRDGDINALVLEGRALQHSHQKHSTNKDTDAESARIFSRLMMQGKVKAALRVLSNNSSGGILPLEKQMDGTESTVFDILREKHPAAQDINPEAVVPESAFDQSRPRHPVQFDRLNGNMIRTAALQTQGGAGPSGVDAAGWRRLCTAFHGASRDLCNAVAQFARRIATTFVDPAGLSAFIACRLIPLDKRPGVRPIGICETVRRIVGKAVMSIVRHDVQEAAGPLQLCAGQQAGCEAAVHALRTLFDDTSNDGLLLVDASNAFNSLNRALALVNIRKICPIISPILTNTYRTGAELFVMGEVIHSMEGTTQGDPLAMAMYALAVVPLVRSISTHGASQVWFADDASAGGRLLALRLWWDALVQQGPLYGYFPNARKTWLVVKPEQLKDAEVVFVNTGVQSTAEGRLCLGAPLGQPSFVEGRVDDMVKPWVQEIERLAVFSECHPQAAYSALTHGLVGR